MSKHTVHTEGELLSMLSRGDKTAFDLIFNQYADELYRYAFNQLKSQEDSEDVVQSMFVALWERRELAQHITALRYYLYCSVRYRIIKERKRVRKLAIQQNDLSNHLKVLDNSNLERQDYNDTRQVIEQTIASLPERMQMAFRLSREEHLSNDKIAARMNISQRTVENYITEALKSLRSTLGEAIILLIWLIA